MSKLIELECNFCKNKFKRPLRQYKHQKKISGEDYKTYCSFQCQANEKSKEQKVNCKNCDKEFIKSFSQIKKTNNNFCSQTCSATFNNKNRYGSGLTITCKNCGVEFIAKSKKRRELCDSCFIPIRNFKNLNYLHNNTKKFILNCKKCNSVIENPSHRKALCNNCRKVATINAGLKGGRASVLKQVRRSKNEIYFSELCAKQFNSVSMNEQLFPDRNGNKWDADVIIHDHKIAILWNGIWHYKPINSNHSVKQVQARDTIKLQVIKDFGYIPYIIKDMGRHNKAFVEAEFNKFISWLKTKDNFSIKV